MKINILIVDDKEENLYLLDNLLNELKEQHTSCSSIHVMQALCGQVALKMAMNDKIDLIILDIKMPEMDGFEVAKFLKMNESTKDIPIVFLTAEFREKEFEEQGFEVGAIDYFLKPIQKHKFFNKIKLYVNLLLNTKELNEVNKNLHSIIFKKTQSEKRLQKLFDLQTDLVIVTNGDKTQIVNQTMCDFLSIKNIKEFNISHEDISRLFIQTEDTFSLEKLCDNENWLEVLRTYEEGSRIVVMSNYEEVEHTFKVNVNEFDEDLYIVSFTDISSSMIEKNNLNNRLIKDQLTGIHNREFFQQNITLIVEDTNISRHLGVVIIDIDNFKKVNDTYGHNVGDSVLIEVTNRIKSSIRNDDYLIRWGGDEFILLMKITNLKALGNVIDNIRKIVEKDRFTGVGRITCSFGATLYLQNEDVNITIQRADEVLYKAKDSGKNNVKLI